MRLRLGGSYGVGSTSGRVILLLNGQVDQMIAKPDV